MAEPLQQLRRAIIAGESVEIDDTSIILNKTIRLDRKARTNFCSLHGRGAEYTLDVLYFQYHFRDLPYNDYFQASHKQGVQHVIVIDKKDVLAYLTGKVSTCPGITSNQNAVAPSSDSAHRPTMAAHDLDSRSRLSTSSLDNEGRKRMSTARQSPTATEGNQDGDVDTAMFASNHLRVRDQRSIDSVLMLKDWDFANLREKLVKHVSDIRKGKPVGESAPSQRKSGTVPKGSANVYDPRGDRYTNNEERVWRENLGSDFQELGIDMSGSFKAKPSSNGAVPEAIPPQDRTRNRMSDSRRPSMKQAPAKRQKLDPSKAIPIIIVPTDMASLLIGGNAIEMLQNMRFMSHDEMRKNKIPISQPARLTMYRKPGGNCSCAQYHVVTNPSRMMDEEWDQVVAVVCSGSKWQFQNWPIFKNSTVDLFRRVQGFYFHYDDVNPTGDVEQWAVKKLTVSREKRHMDGQLHSLFWNSVDSFIARNRLPLRY